MSRTQLDAKPRDRQKPTRRIPMALLDDAAITRFRTFYTESSPESCWLWQGSTTSHGRGQFGVGPSVYPAPRIAHVISTGDDPHPLHVLHNCPDGDNPQCVNPAHLWLGTHADNMRDRWAKGRGMVQGRRKIWQEEVEEIKQLRSQGVTWAEISVRFGIGTSTISRALKGPYPWDPR